MKKLIVFVLCIIPLLCFAADKTVVRDKVPFNEITNDDIQFGLQYLRDNPQVQRFIIRVMGIGGAEQIGRIVLTQDEALYLPGKTVDPWPEDGAVDVNPGVGPDGTCCFALSWSVSGDATELPTFDVYLGDASGSFQLLGNSPSSFWPPDGQTLVLDVGQTYLWRVDSRYSTGITPGDVWTFTTGIAEPVF